MKDYKRLTKNDWHNAKFSVITHKDNRAVLHRLWELENRVERGEIDYVADKDKEIAYLTAENTELRATISKMETVEKELRARLEKAVELPCKVGDTVYSIFKFPNEKAILKGDCKHININICGGFPEIFIKLVFETNEQLFLRTYSGNDLNNIFLLRSEAEARLAELKGGRE